MPITTAELDETVRKHGHAPWRYRAKLVTEKERPGTRMYTPHVFDSFNIKDELMVSIGTGVILEHEENGRQVFLVGDEAEGRMRVDDGKWYHERWMAEAAAVDQLENRLLQIDNQINRQLAKVWKMHKEAKEEANASAY